VCRRVRPHTLLVGAIAPTPRVSPGNKSEWRGKSVQKNSGNLPQSDQHLSEAEVLGERCQPRRTMSEGFREQAFEKIQ